MMFKNIYVYNYLLIFVRIMTKIKQGINLHIKKSIKFYLYPVFFTESGAKTHVKTRTQKLTLNESSKFSPPQICRPGS